MLYREGYKYQLAAPEIFNTSFRPKHDVSIARIKLYQDGKMIVGEGYAWDGASGVLDRKTNLRASCGHDALYQLMRMNRLSHTDWIKADNDYCRWLENAGAWAMTVKLDRWGLMKMGGKYAHPRTRKHVFTV